MKVEIIYFLDNIYSIPAEKFCNTFEAHILETLNQVYVVGILSRQNQVLCQEVGWSTKLSSYWWWLLFCSLIIRHSMDVTKQTILTRGVYLPNFGLPMYGCFITNKVHTVKMPIERLTVTTLQSLGM
jgi:hypothetical protein